MMFLAEIFLLLGGMICLLVILSPEAGAVFRIVAAVIVVIGFAVRSIVRYIFKNRE